MAALFYMATMLVALLVVHRGDIFILDQNTGGSAVEVQLLYLFGALALFFTGGGKYALSTRNKWD